MVGRLLGEGVGGLGSGETESRCPLIRLKKITSKSSAGRSLASPVPRAESIPWCSIL